MTRVLVVIPSRGRPENLVKAIRSALATSDHADVVCYIDDDQIDVYHAALAQFSPALDNADRGTLRMQPRDSRVRIHQGKQVGPVAAANTIIHHYRNPYTIYGMIPDDAEFKTPRWDEYLIETVREMPKRIGVVAAAHNGGEYVNFPWVSREWIEAVGWYYYPDNFHFCCDSIVEILGECTNSIVYAPADRFSMHHDLVAHFNPGNVKPDAWNFLQWCVGPRRETVRRVRERIAS